MTEPEQPTPEHEEVRMIGFVEPVSSLETSAHVARIQAFMREGKWEEAHQYMVAHGFSDPEDAEPFFMVSARPRRS